MVLVGYASNDNILSLMMVLVGYASNGNILSAGRKWGRLFAILIAYSSNSTCCTWELQIFDPEQ